MGILNITALFNYRLPCICGILYYIQYHFTLVIYQPATFLRMMVSSLIEEN